MALRYTDSKGLADSALVCYTIVANRYYERKLDRDELYLCVNAMANLGYLYCSQYFDYQKSYSYLQQSLDIAKQQHFNRLLSYIYLNMAVLSATYEDLRGHESYSQETLRYLDMAYRTATDTKEWRAALYCLNDILDIKFNERADLQTDIKRLAQLKAAVKEPLYPYIRLMCRGMEAYANKDYRQADSCFLQMYRTPGSSEKGNQDILRLKAMRYRAAILYACGHDAEATALLHDIIQAAETGNLPHIKVWIYKIMYEKQTQAGQTAQADRYQLKYYQAKEQLSLSGHIEDIGQMRFLYQLKQVNDKVKDLSRQRQQQRTLFTACIVVALTVIIALIISLRYYRRQKNFIQNLYDKNMALLDLHHHPTPADNLPTENESDDTGKYATSSLNDQSKEELLQRIDSVINDTAAICSPDFSVKWLCDKIGSNTTYVSQVINEKYGMNFKSLVNERRIAEACRRLGDPQHYGHYTIEAIATSVGFKSRTNFASVFKRSTGLSASEFQKAAMRKS